MDKTKYTITISAYDFNVMSENFLIAGACKRQLDTAIKQGDEVHLSLTLDEFDDLIGYVAAEANHATTKRTSADLNELCDELEGMIDVLRRQHASP